MFKRENYSIVSTAVLILLLTASCEKKKPVIDYVTFEELELTTSGFWNGSNGSGGFTSHNLFFINHYDSRYSSWGGFAYTNHTDVITSDYTNQYSSIAGSGADGSGKYGVFYFTGVADTLIFQIPEKISHISLSNSTYSYHAIKNGNSFCKKFGGDTGNDPDWFKLTLTAIDETGFVTGIVEVMLADYRFDNNANDYIGNVWTDLDLSSLGYIKALKFEMSSSDSGTWGMNNPGYICIDNIKGQLDVPLE